MDKEAFQGWKAQEERQGQQRRARQEETNRRIREVDALTAAQNHFLRTLLKFREKSGLDSEMLHTLVERINVFPGKRVEIVFRFKSRGFGQTAGQPEGREAGWHA